jgi:PPE-repeat protein
MMSVFDYAALPPEINSGRMYVGAGSGPLLAAVAAWDGLASELSLAASSYQSTVSELTGGAWLGPASVSMAAAAAPYVGWMNATAAQAEQTADQARAAAAAYEAAFSAHVPPPLIAANRSLLMSLVATNIVGQNTPAIAATEAQYAQMWAQDAAAMYGYAGASAAATTLTPFTSPTQNTHQAAAVTSAAGTSTGTAQNAVSQVASTLQSLASANPVTVVTNGLNSPLNQAISGLLGAYAAGPNIFAVGSPILASDPFILMTPLFQLATGAPAAAAAPAIAAAPASELSAAPAGAAGTLAGSYGSGAGSAGLGGAGVSAGLGRAGAVGGLSVPQSWATGSPAIRLAATALPAAGLDGVPEAGAAAPPGWFGGMPPMVGGVVNAPRKGAAGAPSESRLRVIPQLVAAPGVHEGTPDRGMKASGSASDALGALSGRERNELDDLREAFAELTMDRDAAARLIKEIQAAQLIKEMEASR